MSRTNIDPSLLKAPLPISVGGTNNNTALNNGYLMRSASGAIVESSVTCDGGGNVSCSSLNLTIGDGVQIEKSSNPLLYVNDSLGSDQGSMLMGTGIPTSNVNDAWTAFGYHALHGAGASTGIDETAFGTTALENDSGGTENTAIGAGSMQQNTTGTNNTALGADTLWKQTGGSFNTAIGVSAMSFTGTCTACTAVGESAMLGQVGNPSALTVSYVTAIGAAALSNLTTGSYNTAVGAGAGQYISSGATNVCFGYQSAYGTTSGAALETGSNNVVIGNVADVTATNTSNAIAIGYQAEAASNNTVIGNSATIASRIYGNLTLVNGSVGTPALNLGDSTTGFYRNFSNQLSITLAGILASTFATTGNSNAVAYNPFSLFGGSTTAAFVEQSTTGVSTTAITILASIQFCSLCLIFGNDGGGNQFADLILMSVGTGTVNVISSLSAQGTPTTRTYSQASSTLKLAMGSGTYTVKVLSFQLS